MSYPLLCTSSYLSLRHLGSQFRWLSSLKTGNLDRRGFPIALLGLNNCDHSPWSLDLEATARYLGLSQKPSLTDENAAISNSDLFHTWISSLGSRADNEKLVSLLVMLYRSWAHSASVLCFFILAVSFLVPKNRPLVITVQVICCLSLISLERYTSEWHSDSQHRVSIIFLLGLNLIALCVNMLDYYIYKRKIASKKS